MTYDKRAVGTLTATILAALAVAGCSQKTEGAPVAASSNAPATKVAQPLDPTPFLNKPCDLVPQSLLQQLGYTAAGKPKTGADAAVSAGPTCSWLQTNSSKLINVGIQRAPDGTDNGGMANVFAAKGSLYAYVEPTDISGYPAAYADLSDRRSSGDCGIFVGIRDELTISADSRKYQGAQDSCEAVRQLATAMVQTLKGGS